MGHPFHSLLDPQCLVLRLAHCNYSTVIRGMNQCVWYPVPWQLECCPLRPLPPGSPPLLSDMESRDQHSNTNAALSCMILANVLAPSVDSSAEWVVQSLPASSGCCGTQVRHEVLSINSEALCPLEQVGSSASWL